MASQGNGTGVSFSLGSHGVPAEPDGYSENDSTPIRTSTCDRNRLIAREFQGEPSMKFHSPSRFVGLNNRSVAHILLTSMFLVVAACSPTLGQAQEQPKPDPAKNVGYVHPPDDAPALKLNKDPQHPAPQPNAGPKAPAAKTVNRGALPRQIPAGMY